MVDGHNIQRQHPQKKKKNERSKKRHIQLHESKPQPLENWTRNIKKEIHTKRTETTRDKHFSLLRMKKKKKMVKREKEKSSRKKFSAQIWDIFFKWQFLEFFHMYFCKGIEKSSNAFWLWHHFYILFYIWHLTRRAREKERNCTWVGTGLVIHF